MRAHAVCSDIPVVAVVTDYTVSETTRILDPGTKFLACDNSSLTVSATASPLNTYKVGDTIFGILSSASANPTPCTLIGRKVHPEIHPY